MISNKSAYNGVMTRIDTLMKKGEGNLTKKENIELRQLALNAQTYEKSIYTIPAPTTIEGMIELRMYEMKLKQHQLAEKLGVSNAKLSLILNGKQKMDLNFLKAVHRVLKVDADFLLAKG